MKEKIKRIFIIALIIFGIFNYTFADVGDFESYDTDWGSDYGSDWGIDWSSSSDYDYYNYGGYSYYDDEDMSGTLIWLVIIMIIVIASKAKNRVMDNPNKNYSSVTRPVRNYSVSTYVRNPHKSEMVADEVRKYDKYFNDEQFLAKVKTLFVKLQNAWSERNWEEIRPLESEELFEQHSRQLKGYIDRKQINKMERICVNFAELVSFSQDNEKDVLVVALNSSMLDYIVDEETGNVLKGSKQNRITNTYKMIFTRKKGILTKEGTDKVKTTNCPNCGAPTTVTSSGKCEFCNAVITIGAHDWVLGDMERF